MKKRTFLFPFALAFLMFLSACGGKAQLSGEAAELADIQGHPVEAAILEGLRRGLYDAPSDGLFRPDEPATGAEFVTALWNLAGRPGDASASDAQTALAWAKANAFLDGGAFDPDAPITRQDAMRLLFAYNGGVSGTEIMLTAVYDDAFSDSAEIPAGGKPSLYWGFYNVLIREPEPDKIAPSGAVSRGDMAAALVRYMDDFQSQSPTN